MPNEPRDALLGALLIKVELLAQVVGNLDDIDDAIATFVHAQDFGPFIDPTAWRNGLDDRAAILDLLKAVRAFRCAAKAFHAKRAEILAARGATS